MLIASMERRLHLLLLFCHFFLILSSTAISDYKQSLQFQSLNEEKRNIHMEVCFYDFLWCTSPPPNSLLFFLFGFAPEDTCIGYSRWQKSWNLYIWHSGWWCYASQHRWSGTCFILALIVVHYSRALNILLTWHSKSLHRFLLMEYWFLVTLSQLMNQVWLGRARLWAFLPILRFY